MLYKLPITPILCCPISVHQKMSPWGSSFCNPFPTTKATQGIPIPTAYLGKIDLHSLIEF